MAFNSPFDNAVLPSVTPDSDHTDQLGGFDLSNVSQGAGSGTLNSPMGDTNFVGSTSDKETSNTQSGLPQRPTVVQVDGAPATGATVPMPDMTTTPNPKL
jgi:hypothetical protein